LRTLYCSGGRTSGVGPQTSDFRPQTSGVRLQAYELNSEIGGPGLKSELRSPMSDVRRPISARDRGLVFRPSTGAEVGDVFIRPKQRLGAACGGFGCALVERFHVFLYPADAGDFDLAVLRDPEYSGDIRESV